MMLVLKEIRTYYMIYKSLKGNNTQHIHTHTDTNWLFLEVVLQEVWFFLLCIFLYFPICYKSKCNTKINIIWGEWGGTLNRTGPRTKPGHTHSLESPLHTAPGSFIIFLWDWSFNQLQTNPLRHIITIITSPPSYPRVHQRSLAISLPKSRYTTSTIFPWSTGPVTLSPQGNLATLTWLVWTW